MRLRDKAQSQTAICMITLDAKKKSMEIAHIISREKRIMDFEVSNVSGMTPEGRKLTRSH